MHFMSLKRERPLLNFDTSWPIICFRFSKAKPRNWPFLSFQMLRDPSEFFLGVIGSHLLQ